MRLSKGFDHEYKKDLQEEFKVFDSVEDNINAYRN